MKENHASRTAEGAAAMRAAGRYENVNIRNPDNLAEKLVGPKYQIVVKNRVLRHLALSYFGYKLPGMYEVHLTRTHHFDRIVANELSGRAEQLLVLGAGLDTRPYRFRPLLRGRAFEVDHPATSRFKRERLRIAGVDQSQVCYVEVDFEKQSTEEQVLKSGLNPAKPTVVTWEGVIMYLNRDSVDQVMEFVRNLAPGSSIVFDYVYPSFYRTPGQYQHAKRHLKYVQRLDEPYTFGLEFGEVADYVASHSLTLESNISAKELDKNYLPQWRQPVTPWYAIAHARNNG